MSNSHYTKDCLNKNVFVINKSNNKINDSSIDELEEKLRKNNKLVMTISYDEIQINSKKNRKQ